MKTNKIKLKSVVLRKSVGALLSITLALGVSLNAQAKQSPLPYPSDNRIKMVAYQENNVVPVYGKTFTSTQLIFGKGEKVLDVEGGDTDGWVVTHHQHLTNMLFVKPTILGSDSNMVVVTNKHNYYFHVMSNRVLKADQRGQTYAIKFIYPKEERDTLNRKLARLKRVRKSQVNKKRSPGKYNWQYTFSGNRQIMPSHVFDDGTFTFFEMRPNQPAPAIFEVSRNGKESLLNIRRSGNYLVVQKLGAQFSLRQGKERVASVFNQKIIKSLSRRA